MYEIHYLHFLTTKALKTLTALLSGIVKMEFNNFTPSKMKKLIYIPILFLCLFCKAQDNIIAIENQFDTDTKHQDYFKDINGVFDKYIGTWVFDDGTHYLKITFTKAERIDMYDLGFEVDNRVRIYYDMLFSKFIYKLNGETIYDTVTNPANSILPYISGSVIEEQNQVSLHYDEPTDACRRGRNGNLILTYQTDGLINPTETLTWVRTSNTPRSSRCYDGSPMDNSDYIIPANMTLIKQ